MSYSKINTYKGCPFAYFLNYGLGVVVPDSPALAFGGTLHIMAKKFWETNYKSDKTFANAFRGMWIQRAFNKLKGHRPIAFRYKEEPWVWLKQGEKIVKLFYEQNIEHKQNGEKPLFLEEKFDLPFRNFIVTGKIDRIDNFNGKRKIYDYKSDRIIPVDKREANFVYNSQFVIYELMHKKAFNEEAEVYVWYLRNGKKFHIDIKPEDEDYLEELLTEVTSHIKKDEFPMFKGFHCKSACQYFKTVCKYIDNPNNRFSELEEMVKKGKVIVSKNKWIKYKETERKKLIIY